MASLLDVIQDPAKRRAVVEDCVSTIEAEVADKRGVTGIAIKAAFKTVKSVKPGMIGMAMDHLLDDFSKQIDPFWAECQQQGADARTFFVARKLDIANALLSITDARALHAKQRVLKKAYNKLRPQAVKHVGDAMGRVGALLSRHAS